MHLSTLGDLELQYTHLESLDYGADGQLFGSMEGQLRGDQIRGTLRLTNLAPRRSDNVNLPTLRGLLTTEDGATVYVTMDGVAKLRTADNARVFVTSVTFRTGDSRYTWLNTVLGLLEGVLDSVGVGGRAHGRIHQCEATLT